MQVREVHFCSEVEELFEDKSSSIVCAHGTFRFHLGSTRFKLVSSVSSPQETNGARQVGLWPFGDHGLTVSLSPPINSGGYNRI